MFFASRLAMFENSRMVTVTAVLIVLVLVGHAGVRGQEDTLRFQDGSPADVLLGEEFRVRLDRDAIEQIVRESSSPEEARERCRPLFEQFLVEFTGQQLPGELWAQLRTIDEQTVQWAADGFRPVFKDGVDPDEVHTELHNKRFPEDEYRFGCQEVLRMIRSGEVELVDGINVQKPDLVMKVHFVAKQGKKDPFRLIHDCRPLNKLMEPAGKFRLNNLVDVARIVEPGMWLGKSDIKKAYHHVAIPEDVRRFFGFSWTFKDDIDVELDDGSGTVKVRKGRCFLRYTVLPFGLSHAPLVWNSLTAALMAEMRARGASIVGFFDDFEIFARTKAAFYDTVEMFLTLCRALKLSVDYDKSVFIPTTRIQYLGLIQDSEEMVFEAPQDKIDKVRALIIDLVDRVRNRHGQEAMVTARELAKVAGLLQCMSLALSPAAIMTRRLYRQIELSDGWETPFEMTRSVAEELEFWVKGLDTWNGKSPIKPSLVLDLGLQLNTDAAGKAGWGAVVQIDGYEHVARGNWNNWEMRQDINYKEMKAAWYALQAFFFLLVGRSVRLLMDNTTAVKYIRGGGSKPAKSELARKMWLFCVKHQIHLNAGWVKREFNYTADKLSKEDSAVFQAAVSFKLTGKAIRKICTKFGVPSIDLFASEWAHVVPRYVSWNFDRQAMARDAFTLDWGLLEGPVFVHPPTNLIAHALQHIVQCRCKAIVVVPVSYGEPWWPLFDSICGEREVWGSDEQIYEYLEYPRRGCPQWQVVIALVDGKRVPYRNDGR